MTLLGFNEILINGIHYQEKSYLIPPAGSLSSNGRTWAPCMHAHFFWVKGGNNMKDNFSIILVFSTKSEEKQQKFKSQLKFNVNSFYDKWGILRNLCRL